MKFAQIVAVVEKDPALFVKAAPILGTAVSLYSQYTQGTLTEGEAIAQGLEAADKAGITLSDLAKAVRILMPASTAAAPATTAA